MDLSGPIEYYHSSSRRLRPGLVARVRRDGVAKSPRTPGGQLAERLLEAARPNSMLPRSQSVFMIDSTNPLLFLRAGAALGHAYRVEPEGEVFINHTGWWSLIAENVDNPDVITSHGTDWVESYWRGDPCPDELCIEHCAVPGTWEHRSRTFKVIAEKAYVAVLHDATVTTTGTRIFVYINSDSHMVEGLQAAGLSHVGAGGERLTFMCEANRRTMRGLEAVLQENDVQPGWCL